MPNGMFHRSQPAALHLERVTPANAGLGRLFVVDVPTDLLLACLWATAGLTASVVLAVAFPLTDPLATLLALG